MRQSFCFLLPILIFLSSICYSQPNHNPQLTVFVYDDARVPSVLIEKAEREADRVFVAAGLKVSWTNCPAGKRVVTDQVVCEPLGPPQLSVRIVQRSRYLTDATFGLAYISDTGPSRYCDVFYNRVQDLQQQGVASISSVLGHVLAHEIGHLLLGTNSHSRTGIMRAQWQADELRAASMGRLLFSSEEGERIREQVRRLSGGQETASLLRSGH